MTSGGSADFREQVRARTDLVGLIGESIALKPTRGGADYVGLCPFHDDHNPSLHVYPDRQTYRCWVCDEGGDCFSYVQKIENVGFREALEILARRANLELPRHARPRAGGGTSKPDLYEVLRWAQAQFQRCLLQDPAAERARRYLAERGFTAQTLSTFGAGYHPDHWEWILHQAGTKFTVEQLLEARLVARKPETGRIHDYFVGRVMFPIRDVQGRVVAFGGRILPDRTDRDPRKYFNSPEGPLFTKSKVLYGFDVAKEAVRRSGTAVVMEGYTDCMLAHQFGMRNCVGTLGTALTESHVLALKRFARTVVLVYDGDEAGQRAADRALLKFLPMEVDLRILALPDGLDPAEFLERHGVDDLRRRVEGAVEAWEYKVSTAMARHGLGSIDARQRILEELLELLAQVPRLAGNVRQDLLLGNLAQRLHIDEQTIRQRLSELRRRGSRIRPAAPAGASPGRDQRAATSRDHALERELLEIVFAAPGMMRQLAGEVQAADFRQASLRRLWEVCLRLAEAGQEPSFERVLLELEDAELKRLAVELERSAAAKDVAGRLRSGSALVAEAVRNLKWRQELASHEAIKGEVVQRHGTSSGLDSDDKELLRRMWEFHQKRATRKSLT